MNEARTAAQFFLSRRCGGSRLGRFSPRTTWDRTGEIGNTRYEHFSTLQQELGYRPFLGAARAELERWLAAAALMTCDGADLADAFMKALRDAGIIAPSPSTFDRLVAAALVEAERQVLRMLAGRPPPRQRYTEVEPDRRWSECRTTLEKRIAITTPPSTPTHSSACAVSKNQGRET